MPQHPLFIGIDLGTSGVRACAINEDRQVLHLCVAELTAPKRKGSAVRQDATLWWSAVQDVLSRLFQHIDAAEVASISVNGTSGTLLACDETGNPLGSALMYNDASCTIQAETIANIAPADCAAHGNTSGLAKLMYLQQQYPDAVHFCHQADWLAGMLSGRFDISDENNALKSGYDPVERCWPNWIAECGIDMHKLPEVIPPGKHMGKVREGLFAQAELNPNCKIIAGTTDSIAAFIATGANQPGDAVTSLGSTLVLKVISPQPVSAAEYGIYSHRYGDYWLAGGASNSGGAVLKKFFSQSQLDELTPQLEPGKPTGLDYYPLAEPGERFPVNDPFLLPRMEPPAKNPLEQFQAMLEGMARIEHDGYKKLQQLGAPYPSQVETAGGGSKNTAWAQIRQQQLGVNVNTAAHSDACYGSALLAMQGYLAELQTGA